MLGFHASLICYDARLVKVKNVSAGASEQQALSNLTRFSRSRDPIMKYVKYDSLSTLMSPVDVGANCTHYLARVAGGSLPTANYTLPFCFRREPRFPRAGFSSRAS